MFFVSLGGLYEISLSCGVNHLWASLYGYYQYSSLSVVSKLLAPSGGSVQLVYGPGSGSGVALNTEVCENYA